ncbi:hypothetical protein HMPREF0044_1067 [Gleimia coleocanis DSM 15436]|uniref:UmuC domain-containing protein n=1 Tax=Gleimia coleocanis DSM 15436 TaxID=525245 RepID=C0W0I9_9ACTO|nr:hypothetical protein [Gleimia coleocanis]EEH64048.1 hypothetical protein HMPREF0044_1067 [Gleimia coleocanis DSM 15436]
MPVVLVLIPDWETNSLVVEVPPGASAVTVNKGKVSAVTKAATHFGVEVGMKLGLAQQLCADLVVLAEDKLRAQRAFLPVLEALDEVSAFVQAVRPGLAIFHFQRTWKQSFWETL